MENLPYVTGDGSASFFSEKYGETYHSRHGAIQESLHVFIEMGLRALPKDKHEIAILEMGLGTGLNVFLTAIEAIQAKIKYVAIEAEPVDLQQISFLNYNQQIEVGPEAASYLEQIHQSPWNSWESIHPKFDLFKFHGKLQDFQSPENQIFDLIYFDAFAPGSQPELWTEEVFKKVFGYCKRGAFLTTYCAKGAVRRAMQAAGFEVERLPGPPGKREMLRAQRL